MKKLLLIALLPLVGCVGFSTEYRPYEGTQNLYQGRGATKAVVDGMEIWDGEPPRKYMVLGVLKDERPGAVVPMAMLRGSMVKEAKAKGGDALIDMGGSSQFTGTIATGVGTATAYGNSATAVGTSSSVAVRRNYSTWAVIRYVE